MTWRFCGFPAFASGLFSAQSAGGALSGRPGYLQPIIVDGVGQFRAACVAAFAVYKLRLTAPQNDALIGGVIFCVLSRACARAIRSEEHTSELQSQSNLLCRLLLEKKKKHLQVPTV